MVRYHTYDAEGPPQATFSTATSTGSSIDSTEIRPPHARVGVVFTWESTTSQTVKSRVGISFISVESACAYYQDEIPSWDVNDTVSKAVEEWNTEVFNKIQVNTDADSANNTNLRLLYSSLYFMHLMPSNRTGENPLWDSDEPYWDDFCKLKPISLI